MTRVQNVNTTDLKAALKLGGWCMSGLFNADDPEGVAFFSSSLRPRPACPSASPTPSRTCPAAT